MEILTNPIVVLVFFGAISFLVLITNKPSKSWGTIFWLVLVGFWCGLSYMEFYVDRVPVWVVVFNSSLFLIALVLQIRKMIGVKNREKE